MPKILLLEDSLKCQGLVLASVGAEFEIIPTKSCLQALDILSRDTPDIILADIHLPDMNGFEFYMRMLALNLCKTTPLIYMSADSDIKSKTMAFQLGASDYLVKPFDPVELRLRMAARMRESKERLRDNLQLADLRLNQSQQKLSIYKCGEVLEINLSPLEFRLLLFLAEHPGIIFSRNQLLDSVWGCLTHLTDRTIDRHVSVLRKKLETSSVKIQSIYGSGYQLVVGSKLDHPQ